MGVWGGEGDSQAVMWAVTDMEAVPPGAMLINPQVSPPRGEQYKKMYCTAVKERGMLDEGWARSTTQSMNDPALIT